MKVSYCLTGVAMAVLAGQTDAWGFPIITAVINFFKKPAPAPAPTPAPTTAKPTPAPTIKTKTILMRSTIVPAWTDVAPTGATQISLSRVNDYWVGLKNSDLTTYAALYTNATEIAMAKTKITAYYDDALKCLNVTSTSLTTKTAPDVFKIKMDAVTTCLSTCSMPSFVVLDSNMVTPNLSTYMPKLEASDVATPTPNQQLVAQLTPTTPAPTPTPTPAPVQTTAVPVTITYLYPTPTPETPAPAKTEAPISFSYVDSTTNQLKTIEITTELVAPGTGDASIPPSSLDTASTGWATKVTDAPTSAPTPEPTQEKPTEAPIAVTYVDPDTNKVKVIQLPEALVTQDTNAAGVPLVPVETMIKSTDPPIAVTYVDPETNKVKVIQLPDAIVTQDTNAAGVPLTSLDTTSTTDWSQTATAKDTEPPVVVTYVDPNTHNVEMIKLPEDLVTQPTTSDGTPLSALDNVADKDTITVKYVNPDTNKVEVVKLPEELVAQPRTSDGTPLSALDSNTNWGEPTKATEEPIAVTYVDPETNKVKVVELPETLIDKAANSDSTSTPVDTSTTGWSQSSIIETDAPITVTYMDPDTNMVKTVEIPQNVVTQAAEDKSTSTKQDDQPTSEPDWDHSTMNFGPTTPTVPIFWALDLDKDARMTPSEWREYVLKLDHMALASAAKAKDKEGQRLLRKIIDFHYESLQDCIFANLDQANMEVMNAAQFEVFASRVEKNCNVKFKYSLLAGTPPFEWVAGKKTAVTASEIMDWFSTKLNRAAKDVTKKSAKPESLQQFPARKHFVHCIQDHVGPYQEKLVDRTQFYSLINSCTFDE